MTVEKNEFEIPSIGPVCFDEFDSKWKYYQLKGGDGLLKTAAGAPSNSTRA